MDRYDFPPRLEGTAEEQLQQLWGYLFRLVERMNLETQKNSGAKSGG